MSLVILVQIKLCQQYAMNFPNDEDYSISRGRTSMDDPRAGRSSTATTDATLASISSIVEDDRVTLKSVSTSSGLFTSSVHSISHHHLGMSKVSARWVPRILTIEQK